MLRFVDHRNSDIENPFLCPSAPVLINAPKRFCRIPRGLSRTDAAERDKSCGDFQVGFNGKRIQIDSTHDICDLITSPLVPLQIIRSRRRTAERNIVVPLKTFNARRVITNVGASRRCLTGDTEFRITNAIKVQAVNVVILHKVSDDIDGVFSSVRMTKIYPEVAPETVTLIRNGGAPGSSIGKQRTRQPVVGTGNDRVSCSVKATV